MLQELQQLVDADPALKNNTDSLMRAYLKSKGCEILLCIAIVEKFSELKQIENLITKIK